LSKDSLHLSTGILTLFPPSTHSKALVIRKWLGLASAGEYRGLYWGYLVELVGEVWLGVAGFNVRLVFVKRFVL